MSTEPLPAPDTLDQPSGISEVSRLANLLAERVLSEHMADNPVPDDHIRALAQAAQLLDEYEQEVPPLLAPIMDQLRAGAASRADSEPANDA